MGVSTKCKRSLKSLLVMEHKKNTFFFISNDPYMIHQLILITKCVFLMMSQVLEIEQMSQDRHFFSWDKIGNISYVNDQIREQSLLATGGFVMEF